MGNYLSSLKTFSRKPLSSENIVSQDSSSFANTSGTLSTAVSTSLTNSNKSESNSKVKAKKKEKSANTSKMSVILQPTIKQTASVIFLHGLGDTGHGWSQAFAAIKKPYIKYIFPTAPVRAVTLNAGFEMTAWFDILGLKPDAPQDEEGIKKSSQLLLNLVQEEIKNGIPAERIIIGGFSQGGATALYTALTSSMRFGGVLALSTWLPLHHRFPAQLKQCENLASLPIFQAHGDADAVVPFDWSQMSVKALNALGFTDVRFKPYHGLSHSSNDEEMRDVNDFIKNIFPN